MTSSIAHLTPQFPSPDPAAHQVHKPAEQVIIEQAPAVVEPAVVSAPVEGAEETSGEEAQ